MPIALLVASSKSKIPNEPKISSIPKSLEMLKKHSIDLDKLITKEILLKR